MANRGYRGVEVLKSRILCSGQHHDITKMRKAMIKRRNTIEPTIDHRKSDAKLGENWLKDDLGDVWHSILCGAGHNLYLLLHCCAFYACVTMLLMSLSGPQRGVAVG